MPVSGRVVPRNVTITNVGESAVDEAPRCCLTKGCMRPVATALIRGLCMLCYSTAKKMVDNGTTTWTELVTMGLALAQSNSDQFAAAFEEAKRGKDAETNQGHNK